MAIDSTRKKRGIDSNWNQAGPARTMALWQANSPTWFHLQQQLPLLLLTTNLFSSMQLHGRVHSVLMNELSVQDGDIRGSGNGRRRRRRRESGRGRSLTWVYSTWLGQLSCFSFTFASRHTNSRERPYAIQGDILPFSVFIYLSI